MTPKVVINGTTKPPGKPHPSPTFFAHAVLRTTMDHYEEMSQWYIDLLGAEVVHKTANITFLRYDEEHHRIAIFASPEHVPNQKVD
ncbi:uncharacterized protein A1O9_09534 [Exophiala aquamarina CBS 119918]|uniref:Uncharacterized protein n=1 Tax=Exophiala aquamarina CBS 119918 TaxID=1182545 RepID=A0A072P527_9EURO|nr:uncharacterized protein A1O9_09534 [Exophiala aquamarina CBS 119918]KEF54368.1 hypothetical protein A1O9_09534 [Exophiala aquamarina CBS 119918]